MDSLVAANARNARQLMGVPCLSTPSASDTGRSLREKALLRALYPHAAEPAAVPKPTTTTSQAATSSAPAPNTARSLTVIAQSQEAPSALAGSSGYRHVDRSVALLSGAKRGRDDGEGPGTSSDSPILSVDPKQLKSQHALVVAAAAHEAATSTTTAAAAAYRPPSSWKLSKVLVGHQGWVWTAAVDPTNSWFATGGFDAVIKVWDLTSGALKMNLTGHKEAVRAIALSATSPYMYSGSDDHAVKCWDLERNEVVREFFGHRSAVHCVAVHPTLNVVLSGGRDKTVRVWDVRTRACVHTMEGHTDSVMSLVSQQADPQVISGGSDGMIYLWDLASGKPITRLTRHTKPVRGLSLTPSGAQLVSCAADEIRFWKMPTGEFECNATTLVDKAAASTAPASRGVGEEQEELAYRWSSCAISPRNVLAVGSQDGHLGFYDMNRPQSRSHTTRFYCPYQMTKTRSLPGTLIGEGGVNCVVYDASGTRMITAESDKSVKMWKMRDG